MKFFKIDSLLSSLRRVTSTGTYDARLDGLRALAILPVLVWHMSLRGNRMIAQQAPMTEAQIAQANLIPHGVSGVMLFFFVSGLIIAFPFLRAAVTDKPRPSTGSFYLRRLTRLMPAYFIALTLAFVALIVSGYAPSDAPSFSESSTPLPVSYLASLFYQHNLLFGTPSRIIPPSWSLEVEIQFYLFAPFLLIFYAKLAPALRRTLVAVLIVASLLLVNFVLYDLSAAAHEYSVLGYLHYFLAGILVSDLTFGNPVKERKWGDLLFLAGYVVLLAAATIRPDSAATFFARDAGMFVGVLATYWGGMSGKLAHRLLSLRPIAVMGGACYSIYLTHLPIIQAYSEVAKWLHTPGDLLTSWALMLPSIPIAIVAGMVFYALIEHPTMRPDWPQRLRKWLGTRLSPATRAG